MSQHPNDPTHWPDRFFGEPGGWSEEDEVGFRLAVEGDTVLERLRDEREAKIEAAWDEYVKHEHARLDSLRLQYQQDRAGRGRG